MLAVEVVLTPTFRENKRKPRIAAKFAVPLIRCKTMNIVDVLHDCKLFSRGQAGRLPAVGHNRPALPVSQGTDGFPRKRALPRASTSSGRGWCGCSRPVPGGKEHVLHMVGPGESFAEVAAIGGFPLPASAEALKKTTCVLLPLERFRHALAEDHELCLGMMTSMTIWARRLVTLMEDITLRDAAGRLARFLLELAEVEVRPPTARSSCRA